MLHPNAVLQGRYRIIRQLGRGGMGTVYEAIDQSVSSIVALKEAQIETDEQQRAFEREAKLLANLHHPALPRVSHYFAEADRQYLVMRYISGKDLAELLAARGRAFSLRQVLNWADRLLDLLEYLHNRPTPIFHRDIKPSNLRLTEEGELFLLDFGLAKGSAGQMSTLGQRSLHGFTPVYAPLEQIRGTGTDQRSDIYSLGATLHHLMIGEPPPDSLTRVDAVTNGESDPLELTYQGCQVVPESVSHIITWAMSLNRSSRPGSASEMRERVRSACTSLSLVDTTDKSFISPLRDSRLLTTANRIATAIRDSLELGIILQTTVDEVGRALGAHCCALRVEGRTADDALTYLYSEGSEMEGLLREQVMREFDLYHSRFGGSLQPFIRDWSEESDGSEGGFQIAIVPMIFHERFIGALLVTGADPTRTWNESEFLLLHTAADQVAVAINHADLFAQIQQQALTDALTGCYNRRSFEMQLDLELKVAKRLHQPVALIMVDIDHLKSINQASGSKVGDTVLKSVAQILREELRAVDTAARYGSVDFTLIVPRAFMDGAMLVAERIRLRIENLDIGEAGPVTASIGVASFPIPAGSRNLLLETTERCLFQAKGTGRNRICSADALPSVQ